MKSPLAPGPLSRSFCAALHLLTRQSVTPLSRAAFVRQPELLCEAILSHWSYSRWPTPLKRTAAKLKAHHLPHAKPH
jgi:hypothetical protein